MVHKFQDLTTGLRHQVATTVAERDQLRSELINRSNLLKQHSRKVQSHHHHRPSPNVKELKILARIHRRLIDLKMSTAANKGQEDVQEENENLPPN